jgi:hypothetical protein
MMNTPDTITRTENAKRARLTAIDAETWRVLKAEMAVFTICCVVVFCGVLALVAWVMA